MTTALESGRLIRQVPGVYFFAVFLAGFFAAGFLAAGFFAAAFFFAGIQLLLSSASVDGRIIVCRVVTEPAGAHDRFIVYGW
jgi:hypothetical protein